MRTFYWREGNTNTPPQTVTAHGYEHAFEKIYPKISHLEDDAEVHIFTEHSRTGYHFTLGFWRPIDGENWCLVCEAHMLTIEDNCVECGARTRPIGE